MRFVVFLLGLLGSLTTGAMGLLWLLAGYDRNLIVETHQLLGQVGFLPADIVPDPGDPATLKAALFLLAGVFVALFGSLLVLFRRGLLASVLMLLAVVGPALLHHATLTGTGILILAALLSLFVRRRPETHFTEVPGSRLAAE